MISNLNMANYWLALTFILASVQMFHTYWAIDKFSTLKGRARRWQAALFCAIIELAIIGFAFEGSYLLAACMVILAVLTNFYYYQHSFRKDQKANIRWLAYVYAVAMPALILAFTIRSHEGV